MSPPTLATPFAAAHGALTRRDQTDPPWVRERRAAAFARCAARPLPSRRDEDWKYTSLRQVADLSYGLMDGPSAFNEAQLAEWLEPDDVTLVFVDGVLATAYSRLGELPPGITILPLSEAFKQRGAAVQQLLSRSPGSPAGVHAAASESPFAALNDAFLTSGVLIEVERGKTLERRIHLVHATAGSADQPVAFFPRHLIVLGESAAAQVVETFLGPLPATVAAGAEVGQPYLVASVTDLVLGANASLRHAHVQMEGPRAFHLARINATLARDAALRTLSFSAGARLARVDLTCALTGPGAGVDLAGLYLAKGDQHVDHHTTVDHLVPDARSAQLYKGIVGGAGRAVFNGKVLVRQDAQRTSALQVNRNLLLSPEAEVDTKPELQIDADDVKCSHGATVGQLDRSQLFYLESRGLRRAEAERLLAEAFADEVLLEDTVPGLRAHLRPLARGYFS